MFSKMKKLVAVTLIASMLLTMAACNKNTDSTDSSSTSSSSRLNPSDWENPLDTPELVSEYQVEVPKENMQKLEEIKGTATDAVAWLQIPNTDINEAVVQTTDNDVYYRADIYRNYAFEGCLYMDYECDIKDGTKADMPQNTIIYGHNLGNPQGITDDPNGVKFAQLLHFNDIEFAKANPYIYLTTENEDLIYQVFAVIYTEAQMKPVSYIYPSYSNEDFMKLISDIRSRSIYDYKDVTVSGSDKILTLSTCTYKYGTYKQNDQQRFVVFGKLVKDKNFVETANIEAVENPKQPTF